jgi:hypothetical protein
MEILVFLAVLAVVFAAKAASVMLAADDAVSKSVSFSWVKPEMQAEDSIPAWAVETEPRTVAVRPAFRATRRAHA